MLEIGDKVPAVRLADDGGGSVSIEDLPKPLVVFFYPKDDTPG